LTTMHKLDSFKDEGARETSLTPSVPVKRLTPTGNDSANSNYYHSHYPKSQPLFTAQIPGDLSVFLCAIPTETEDQGSRSTGDDGESEPEQPRIERQYGDKSDRVPTLWAVRSFCLSITREDGAMPKP